MDAVKFSQSYNEFESINAAHNLPYVDRPKTFAAALTIAPGTLLKDSGGDKTPWIQGVDAATLITGVYSGPAEIDTDDDTIALVRIFGPIRKAKLIAWTAADGSTTADPSAAAIAQLESMHIFAL